MDKPVLSVIIPVYNVEEYIKECLESILNQTLKNIEVICIDDCSPDKSADIIKEYAANDNRVKYIKHTENKFQGGARNTGIQAAAGKYITFVDSDDYLFDMGCYKNAVDNIEKYGADISIFSFAEDYGNKKTNHSLSKSVKGLCRLNSTNFTKVLCVPWNKIFKLDDIKKHNLTFPEKLKFEDEAFWYKYVAAVEPKAYVDNKYCYAYRIRSGSTMDTRDKYIYDYLDILLNIHEYLVKINKEKYYGAQLANLLYSPAKSDMIFKLSNDELNIISDKFAECITKLGLTSAEINQKAGCRVYAYFIKNNVMRKHYIENTENLKKVKYQILKPNILLYKIKREIKRIFKKN